MSMKLPVVLGAGLLIGLGGYFYTQSSDVQTASLISASGDSVVASAGESYSAEQLSQMAPADLMDMQKQSFSAVLAAANNASEATSINERPAYISPAEWIMLSSVADQKEDSAAELVRLVNLVRFNKQLELLKKSPDESEREILTEAVLSQLPTRIQNKELSIERAQSIQLQLIESLYSDPNDVRTRAAQEAERIGAVFAIEQS